MTHITRSVTGGAPPTVLAAPITAASPGNGATFSVAAGKGTGYPSANGVIKINAGEPTEEKILYSSRSGDIFTVATGGRGYDGTTAADHGITELVTLELDAICVTALLEHVNTNAGDDHPDYHNNARGDARYDALGLAATAETVAKAFAIQRANHTGTQLHTTISDFDESVQDLVGALVQDSASIDATYNDAGAIESLVTLNGVPTGLVLPGWTTATPPTGYLLADGSAVSRSTYATLFAVIGTVYGAGDGSTTFNVPNIKGKVMVGRDAAQTEFDVIGETGGAKTHTLATAELPAHLHSVDPPSTSTSSNGAHTHTPSAGGSFITNAAANNGGGSLSGGNNPDGSTTSDGAHTHSVDIAAFNSANTGGGGAHNNLQPYIVLVSIIKT